MMINKTLTRLGILKSKNKIIKGRMIKIPTNTDASKTLLIIIGIDLRYSPIIPVVRRRGTKAQTVVRVVISRVTKKSR